MLYIGLMMGGILGEGSTVDINSGINKNEIHNIIKSLHRLLSKVECGNCKNC